jgi:hypothetical protein
MLFLDTVLDNRFAVLHMVGIDPLGFVSQKLDADVLLNGPVDVGVGLPFETGVKQQDYKGIDLDRGHGCLVSG